MSAPLDKGQKAYLAILATRAYNRECALALGRGEQITESAEQWRHLEVAKAVGKLGLRCCSQHDYKIVEGHFLNLLNQPGRAFKAFVRGATEEVRTVRYKIRQACREFSLDVSYAEAICKKRARGKGIEEVEDVNLLWTIFYTVRNRGLHKKREAAAHC